MIVIHLSRKPLIGTVAANVLKYGTGGLNIAACRIGEGTGGEKPDYVPNKQNAVYGEGMGGGEWANVDGRWPANLILTEKTAAEMDEQSGFTRSTGGKYGGEAATHFVGASLDKMEIHRPDDEGGASRFFKVFG